MLSSILELFQYQFFVRSLIVGLLISILLSWLGGYVVLRREVLFAHTLSQVAFLGIVFAFMFNFPMNIAIILACVISGYFVNYMQRKKILHSDSLLEIIAQLGIALAVIMLSFFKGYQINLSQFLFGDILAIGREDLITSAILFVFVGTTIIFFHKIFLKISISEILSQVAVRKKDFWHNLLILVLAITIGLAIKIVGVLLVAAFTTIPANIGKLIAKNLKNTFIISVITGFLGTFIGLFVSAFLNTPSGASIVVTLIGMLFISMVLSKRGAKSF